MSYFVIFEEIEPYGTQIITTIAASEKVRMIRECQRPSDAGKPRTDNRREIVLIKINFRMAGCDGQQLIFVSAYVNDHGPYDFILDTGAAISLISPKLSQELAIPHLGSEERMGAGGKVEVQLGKVESLAIGDARLSLEQVRISAELEKIGAVMGAMIDGDIGYDYLKHFRITIDYKERSLLLAQQQTKDSATTVPASIKFTLASPAKPLIVVPVFVNGTGPYQFALDTGAGMTVVSAELAQSLRITSGDAATAMGAGGEFQATVGTVESLAVGTVKLDNLHVVVAGFLSTISQVAGRKLDGIVGYNFLKEFRVTIDYPSLSLCFD